MIAYTFDGQRQCYQIWMKTHRLTLISNPQSTPHLTYQMTVVPVNELLHDKLALVYSYRGILYIAALFHGHIISKITINHCVYI